MEKEFSVVFVVVQVFSPLFFLTCRMTDCRNSSFTEWWGSFSECWAIYSSLSYFAILI